MNKVFICQLCNRQFNRKHNLNRHTQRKISCVVKKSTDLQMNTNEHKRTQMNTNEHKRTQMNINEHKILNQCLYCKKGFANNSSLKRHIKSYCKVKKGKEKEIKKEEEKKNLELELAKKQIEILELQTKVASGNTNCNNNNTNNTVNNTVNVTVNDYGKENINFLESNKYKKLITQILGNGMLGLQQYIKYKYCNPQQPENLTIKYTNDRSNNLKVRTNNEWKTRNKLEVIDELYDRDNNIEEVLNIYECINDLKDDVHMDKIQVHFVDEIDKYYDDDDDKEIKEEMKKMKNKTLNHFYDCYKNNKEKFESE